MGHKMHTYFVPHWSTDARWYYKNFSSEWKRATVFAAAKKWEEAAEVWMPLFEKTTQWKRKARLASNLALCYEIKGDFSKALEYAQTSYDLFAKFTDEENTYRKIQQLYLTNLKKREESDRKLSEQLGE
jgi:tetratricopeptide (TPR) repeat protein